MVLMHKGCSELFIAAISPADMAERSASKGEAAAEGRAMRSAYHV